MKEHCWFIFSPPIFHFLLLHHRTTVNKKSSPLLPQLPPRFSFYLFLSRRKKHFPSYMYCFHPLFETVEATLLRLLGIWVKPETKDLESMVPKICTMKLEFMLRSSRLTNKLFLTWKAGCGTKLMRKSKFLLVRKRICGSTPCCDCLQNEHIFCKYQCLSEIKRFFPLNTPMGHIING